MDADIDRPAAISGFRWWHKAANNASGTSKNTADSSRAGLTQDFRRTRKFDQPATAAFSRRE
jgi:hypothetical protein